MMKVWDNLIEKIENGFGVRGGGNGKLEFPWMKYSYDKQRTKRKKGLRG